MWKTKISTVPHINYRVKWDKKLGIAVLKNVGSKDALAHVSKTKNNASTEHRSWDLAPPLSKPATSLKSH